MKKTLFPILILATCFSLFHTACKKDKKENINTTGIIFNPNLNYGTFTDIRDGREYKTIIIGNQTWMAENISYATPTGQWWFYNNEESSDALYGKLYDGTAALVVCPDNWHLPTREDFESLMTCIGSDTLAGGRLKEATTTHWNTPNSGADNSSGYTALPAGCWNPYLSGFINKGIAGYFWCSTYAAFENLYYLNVWNNNSITGLGYSPITFGNSVRCIMDVKK